MPGSKEPLSIVIAYGLPDELTRIHTTANDRGTRGFAPLAVSECVLALQVAEPGSGVFLACTEDAVARVAESEDDVAVLVQMAVY